MIYDLKLFLDQFLCFIHSFAEFPVSLKKGFSFIAQSSVKRVGQFGKTSIFQYVQVLLFQFIWNFHLILIIKTSLKGCTLMSMAWGGPWVQLKTQWKGVLETWDQVKIKKIYYYFSAAYIWLKITRSSYMWSDVFSAKNISKSIFI